MRRCVVAIGLASLLSAFSPAGTLAQGPPAQTFVNTLNPAGGSLRIVGATTARGPFEPFLANYDPDDGSLVSGFFLPFQGAFIEHTYVDGAGDTHAVVTRPAEPTIYTEILANGDVPDEDGTALPVASAQPFAIVPVGASSIVFANADDQVHAMWFGADGAHRATQSFEFPLTMATFGNGVLADGGNLVVFGNAGAIGGFALRLNANEQTATLTADTTFDGDGFVDVTGLNDVATGTPVQFATAVNPARYVLFGPGTGGVRQQSVGPTGTIAGEAIAVPGVGIPRAAAQLAAGDPVVLAGDVPPSGQSPYRFGLSVHPAGGAQSALNDFAPMGNPTFAEGMSPIEGKLVVAWTDSPAQGTSAGGFSVFNGEGQPVTSVGGTGHVRINPAFDVNVPPTVTLGPGGLQYTEGDDPLAFLGDSVAQGGRTGAFWDGGYVKLDDPHIGDQLDFDAPNAITGTYDPATGVLNLEGHASVTAYQQALRSVRFANTRDDPVPGTRAVKAAFEDGDGLGPEASTTVGVEAVNDPPVNHLPGGQQVKRGDTVSLGSAFISDPDALPTDQMTVRIITSHGDARVDGRSGTDIVLTGTIAQINAKLQGLTFTITTDLAEIASVTFRTSDGGHNGAGGPAEDVDSVRFDLPARPTATPTPTPEPTPQPPPVLTLPRDHSAPRQRLIERLSNGGFERRFTLDDAIITTVGPGAGTFDLFTVVTNPRTGQLRVTVRATEPFPAVRAGANAAARRKPVRYKPKRVTLAPGGEAVIRLVPPRKLKRQLARALKRKGRVSRRPTLRLESSAGGKATVNMRFAVRTAPKRR